MLSTVFNRALNPMKEAFAPSCMAFMRGTASKPDNNSKSAADEGSTYEALKGVAHKTGDASKEWLAGASTTGSSVYKAMKREGDASIDSIKRATEEVTRDAHESKHGPREPVFGSPEEEEAFRQRVGGGKAGALVDKLDAMGIKISQVGDTVAEKVAEMVGGKEEDGGIKSARAVWEATRTEEQKQDEAKSAKSKLTDDAFGDDPTENRTRDEKRILPSDFYTRH